MKRDKAKDKNTLPKLNLKIKGFGKLIKSVH
jgi:hypothetical protein